MTIQSADSRRPLRHRAIDSADLNALRDDFHPADWKAACESDAMDGCHVHTSTLVERLSVGTDSPEKSTDC